MNVTWAVSLLRIVTQNLEKLSWHLISPQKHYLDHVNKVRTTGVLKYKKLNRNIEYEHKKNEMISNVTLHSCLVTLFLSPCIRNRKIKRDHEDHRKSYWTHSFKKATFYSLPSHETSNFYNLYILSVEDSKCRPELMTFLRSAWVLWTGHMNKNQWILVHRSFIFHIQVPFRDIKLMFSVP
jgi:hypothetical protein